MKRLHHVLITRFNVRLGADRPLATDEWLRDRLERFLTYTYPSVIGQTQAPDDWLVFGDRSSPDWFAHALEATSGLRPVWLDGVFGADAVRPQLPSQDGPILTTRFDNDDALAEDFVETLQQVAARCRCFSFINFVHGLQWKEGRLYHRSDPANAFISAFDPSAPARTVFVDQHHRLSSRGPIYQVRGRPMWLQIVHGGNVANDAVGIRSSTKPLSRFASAPPVTDVAPSTLPFLQVASAIRLAGRVLARPHRIAWAWRVIRKRSTSIAGSEESCSGGKSREDELTSADLNRSPKGDGEA